MKVDVRKATEALKDAFKDAAPSQTAKAISRAINHTLGKTKTQANRDVRETFHVKAGDFAKRLFISKASSGKLWGALKASNRPMSLKLFNARQTKKGVSFAIKKGDRQTLPGTFISTVGKNAFKGVFGRGHYVKRGFIWSKKKTPIQGMNSVSAHTALANNTVEKKTAKMTEDNYTQRVQHEIGRLIKSRK